MTDHARPPLGLDLSTDDLGLLDDLLAEEGFVAAHDTSAIRRRADRSSAPLTPAQELIWLLDRASPGLTAYNMAIARRLRGALDVPALRRALADLVQRHDALRTRFAAPDGEPVQIVDEHSGFECEIVDVSGEPDPAQAADRVIRTRPRTRFDLTEGHLLRALLVRVTAEEHVLVIESHHIVCDGWSLGVMLRELAALYEAHSRGIAPSLPGAPIEFGDFAAWQRERLQGEALESLLAFWRQRLAGAVEPLNLSTDRARGDAPSFDGANVVAMLSPALSESVRELGRAHNATLYMTLLAAYMTVLHRYTGREHVLVGSAVAARSRPELEHVVGYVSNTLVQRGDFEGDPTFADFLARVRDGAIAAYDHQDAPLERIALEMRAERSEPAAPLFDVVFTMQETSGPPLAIAGLEVSAYPLGVEATKFDITFLPSDQPDGIRLALQYRSELFERATAERFLAHLTSVLAAAAANPQQRISKIRMLSDRETAELAAWRSGAPAATCDVSVTTFILENAARVPTRPAIVCGDVVVTYDELVRRGRELAGALRMGGVMPGDRVGLLMDRSAEAVTALVGILLAGAAYVPLSPGMPPERMAAQLRAASVHVVVHGDDAPLPDGVRGVHAAMTVASGTGPSAQPVLSSELAYVLFTSGSTGEPKGVEITQANLSHYVGAIARVLGDRAGATAREALAALDGWHFALASTLTADLGNTCLFPALCAGGTLHVLSRDVATEPSRFVAFMAQHPIDVLKITPGHLRALTSERSAPSADVLPRRWLVLGGETLRWDLAEALLAADACRVLNHYGPTEATIGASTFEVTNDSMARLRSISPNGVPIGAPLSNVTFDVRDAAMQPVPVGVAGELYIGGGGVAPGYVGRPELTASAFVTLDDGERVYRTGDRVRWRPGGVVEFVGRSDRQVKLRGFRVELDEIEQVLRSAPGVTDATVLLRDGGTGEPELLGYVATAAIEGGYAAAHRSAPAASATDRVTDWIAARLPEHMRPGTLVVLDVLPRTANGKIDRAALPAPAAQQSAAVVLPETETERKVAAIWGEVLKREGVAASDDFIALGGHSLLAIRILGKITREFGVRLPLRTLFDAPTVRALAAVIDTERASAPAPAVGITAANRSAYRLGGSPSSNAPVSGGKA